MKKIPANWLRWNIFITIMPLIVCSQFQSMSQNILRQNAKQMLHRKIMFAVLNSTDFSACHFVDSSFFPCFNASEKNFKTSDWRFQFSLQSLYEMKMFSKGSVNEWYFSNFFWHNKPHCEPHKRVYSVETSKTFSLAISNELKLCFNRTRQRENKTSFFFPSMCHNHRI